MPVNINEVCKVSLSFEKNAKRPQSIEKKQTKFANLNNKFEL